MRLKSSFVPDQAELYIAEGVGHSDSSQTPDYPEAVRSFVDRYLKEINSL
jgi:hypothetical protein